MNTLFVGQMQGDRCSLFYYNALLQLGHSVYPFDPKTFETDGVWEKCEVKLRRGPTPARVEHFSQQLVRLLRHNPFDLIFVMGENFLSPEAVQEIREIPGKRPVLLYHSHDNNFSKGICKPNHFWQTLKLFDVVFTTKSQNVSRYQEQGITATHFVPSAYEASVHRPLSAGESHSTQTFPVSFIGTFDHSRGKYFSAVGWDRLHIWGDGWQRAPEFSTYRTRFEPRSIYFLEFASVIGRSQCNLGLLREEAEDRHTQRTFEIPACGGLQVAPRNDEILSFFDEEKEIVCFASLDELRDKINYYLSHEEARSRIAKAGHQRVLRSGHSYRERVAQMLSITAAASGRRWPGTDSAPSLLAR